MKKTKLIIAVLSVFLFTGCVQEVPAPLIENENMVGDQNNELSECEKRGGKLTTMDECDGSKSKWCDIKSGKEGCYADLVGEDGCPEQQLSPRVLCDGEEKGQ